MKIQLVEVSGREPLIVKNESYLSVDDYDMTPYKTYPSGTNKFHSYSPIHERFELGDTYYDYSVQMVCKMDILTTVQYRFEHSMKNLY